MIVILPWQIKLNVNQSLIGIISCLCQSKINVIIKRYFYHGYRSSRGAS